MHGSPFPSAPPLFSRRPRPKRSRTSTLSSALGSVRAAQARKATRLCEKRTPLGLALDARRCSPGLLAQRNSRLSQSIFESFSWLNTTTLLHALLLRGLAGARRAISSPKTPRYRAVMAAGCALIPRNTTARIDLSLRIFLPRRVSRRQHRFSGASRLRLIGRAD
jgi:hypothetical protein